MSLQLITKAGCPDCAATKAFCEESEIPYTEIDLTVIANREVFESALRTLGWGGKVPFMILGAEEPPNQLVEEFSFIAEQD